MRKRLVQRVRALGAIICVLHSATEFCNSKTVWTSKLKVQHTAEISFRQEPFNAQVCIHTSPGGKRQAKESKIELLFCSVLHVRRSVRQSTHSPLQPNSQQSKPAVGCASVSSMHCSLGLTSVRCLPACLHVLALHSFAASPPAACE